MLFLISLALADDAATMKAMTIELDGVDALVKSAHEWFAAGSTEAEALAQGETLKESIRNEAIRSRELQRQLIAIKGRLAGGSKQEQKLVPEAEGLQERIRSQNPQRLSALSLIEVGLLIPQVAEDDTAFARLNNSLYTAVQNRGEKADVDPWMRRPIELAVSEEKWNLAFSWATWCEQACTDKKFPAEMLEKVPERHGKDARWLNLPAK